MTDAIYTIDQLCERTGVSRRTVRYYVQEGLLDPPAGKGRGGHYLEGHLERLREIKTLQDQGLTLAAVRTRLRPKDSPKPPGPPGAPPTPNCHVLIRTAADHPLKGCAGVDLSGASPAPEPLPARTVSARYAVAPGIELVVDRDAEEKHWRRISQIARIAKSIMEERD